jgi:hypothetical protein
MLLEKAKERANMPNPKYVPESEAAKRFDVTEMPGGITFYEPKELGSEGNR